MAKEALRMEHAQLVTDALSAGHLHPILSGLVIGLSTVVLLYALVATAFRLVANVRLGLAANRSYQPQRPLRPGRAVVAGAVELLPGEDTAVRVEIDQRGTESRGRGGCSHAWCESGRRVFARPFLLRRPSGEALRVEPGPEVRLVDRLDQTLRRDRYQRTLIGELTPGETVHAAGILVPGGPRAEERGYREAPTRELILRAPADGRLLLAAGPLGARFQARARFHLRWLLLAGLTLLASHLVFFLPYHLRWRQGRTAVAEVTRRESYTTGSAKSRRTYHNLYLKRIDGVRPRLSWRLDAAAESYQRVAVGDRVSLLEITGRSFGVGIQLGARPTLHVLPALLGLGGALAVTIGFVFRRRSSRPWYDRPRHDASGSGPLWPDYVEG